MGVSVIVIDASAAARSASGKAGIRFHVPTASMGAEQNSDDFVEETLLGWNLPFAGIGFGYRR